MFRPSRISSEAPEVIHGPEVIIRPASPEEIALSPRTAEALKHTSASTSSWQEREEQDTDAGSRTQEQSELYQRGDETPPQASLIEAKWRRRRLIVTAVMIAVAFLVGGGIGGGVGSAVASHKARFVLWNRGRITLTKAVHPL